MSLVAQRLPNAFENPNAQNRAKGDIFWVLNNIAINYAKMREFSTLKEAMRRNLNDAVYALGRRPEGYYVAIVIITKDISAGSLKFIQFVRASAGNAAPIGSFDLNFWTRYHLPGHRQHLFIIHNVQGVCPVVLPMGSLNLEEAKMTLRRM